MLQMLNKFSDSFYIALILWPFVAMLLSVPVSIWQYRRNYQISRSFMVFTYASVLYALGLVAFTLYPLPDDPVAYCLTHTVTPQLMPFQWVRDLQVDAKDAIFHTGMNFVFFVPLGVVTRNFFGWNLRKTIIAGFLASLLIEVAQLTALFGLMPCSYRLFDVDDLIVNTAGAVFGFWLGRYFWDYNNVRESNVELTFDRTLMGMYVDIFVVYVIAWFFAIILNRGDSLLGLYHFMLILFGIGIFLTQAVLPYFMRGWTIGRKLIGYSLDTKPRTGLHRVIFYFVYGTLMTLLVLLPTWVFLAFFALAWLYWRSNKTMPYEVVDQFWQTDHSKQ